MIHPDENTNLIADILISYLRAELNDASIEFDGPLIRLSGGFETAIYRFQLKSIPKELDKPLVLRLYPQSYGPENAIWESTIQNALAKAGYPVAAAHFVSTDKAILGGSFFIMDFLSGKPMMTAPVETIPGILGKAHAALHSIDPEPLIKSLIEQGIEEDRWRLNKRYEFLQNIAKEYPWIRNSVEWLLEHRPPEPGRLAICHGDFHSLNILIQDGQVTGVLDWPGFLIADPALDVANTILLTTVPFKHLAPSLLGPNFAAVDWELGAQLYLEAYRAQLPLDSSNTVYYRVRRSIHALIEGFRGHPVWQDPLIVQDLIEFIYQVTHLRIALPA